MEANENRSFKRYLHIMEGHKRSEWSHKVIFLQVDKGEERPILTSLGQSDAYSSMHDL